MLLFVVLTSTDNQDFGFAAGVAVQQRFGPDVEVQQSSCASQLGEGEPHPHKLRLVAEQKGNGVPLLQLDMLGQGSGHSVAFSVGLPIRVAAVLKQQECLLWLLGHSVQKTVQNAVKRFAPSVFFYLVGNFNCSHRVTQVLEKIRVPQVQEEW